jgi:hypothetical protein
VCFWAWEYCALYPMFPGALAQHKKTFTAVLLLCLTSGINYIPGIVFWVIQVYRHSLRQERIYCRLGFVLLVVR